MQETLVNYSIKPLEKEPIEDPYIDVTAFEQEEDRAFSEDLAYPEQL